MRLICVIGAKAGFITIDNIPIEERHAVYEGECYTKAGEFTDNEGTWFFLKERPFLTSYNSNRFIPLSEIDETEMERNYQTKTVTI